MYDFYQENMEQPISKKETFHRLTPTDRSYNPNTQSETSGMVPEPSVISIE